MTVGELAVLFSLKPQGWASGEKMLKDLASAARRYIGVQAVRSVMSLVEHATEGATHLVSMSQAMGLTVEQTQLWGYVAQQSGSNLTQLSIGMNMFLRNLREFAQGRGGKSTAATMRELGISAEEAKAALASPEGLDKALLKISDRFKTMGNDGERAALGARAFGARAGRAMIADLARGSDAIKELMERRRAMGILDEKQAVSLRDLGNRIKDLKTSLGALATQVIGTLAPVLTRMAEGAARWIAAHRELLSGALLTALKLVAGAFKVIAGLVEDLETLIRDALGGDKGAIAIVVGLAAAILSILVPALYAMAAPIVAASLPLLGIAAIVAAITYAVIKLGPAILKGVGEAWTWVKKKAADFWGWLSSVPRTVLDALEGFGQRIIDAFASVWAAIKQGAKDALNYVSDLARDVPVLGFVGEKIGQAAGYVASGGGESAADARAQAAGEARGDAMYDAMLAARANVPAGSPGAGGGGPTHVNVNVNAPIKIDGSGNPRDTGNAVSDHLENTTRSALRGVGGEVK